MTLSLGKNAFYNRINGLFIKIKQNFLSIFYRNQLKNFRYLNYAIV